MSHDLDKPHLDHGLSRESVELLRREVFRDQLDRIEKKLDWLHNWFVVGREINPTWPGDMPASVVERTETP